MTNDIKKAEQPKQDIKLKDVKEGLGILEKLANIFISIFTIFKTKK